MNIYDYQINKFIVFSLFLLLIFKYIYNKEKIIISVIIPTYNRENVISNSVKSVLNQNYKYIEILVIDDGSTGNTQNELKKIKDKRIKLIKLNKNRGGNYARNVGIKLAKGKFISFQDSDDIYHFDKLKKQMKNLYKFKSDFDFCKVGVHINENKTLFYPNKKSVNLIKKVNLYDLLLSEGNFISTQSILVKKNFIDKYLFDINFPRWQDYDLILRIIPNVKVSFTNEVLVDLYKQNNSISIDPSKLKDSIILFLNKNYGHNKAQRKKFIKFLNKIIKKLKDKFNLSIKM